MKKRQKSNRQMRKQKKNQSGRLQTDNIKFQELL